MKRSLRFRLQEACSLTEIAFQLIGSSNPLFRIELLA